MRVGIFRRVAVLLLAFCSLVAHSISANAETINLSIRGNVIQAELATTEGSRNKGLMYREELCKNCGMLFVFPSADKWAFWSKNTPLALSVAFVADTGEIVQVVDMEAYSEQIHVSEYDVVYALEMRRGWFEKQGVVAGDTLNGIRLKAQ